MAALRLKMIDDYEIVFGAPGDIPGILMIQEANLPHNGGTLSVRLSADWFQRAILEESLVVCRREGGPITLPHFVRIRRWGCESLVSSSMTVCLMLPSPMLADMSALGHKRKCPPWANSGHRHAEAKSI